MDLKEKSISQLNLSMGRSFAPPATAVLAMFRDFGECEGFAQHISATPAVSRSA